MKTLLHLACPELVSLSMAYPALVAQVRKSKDRMTAREFAAAAQIKRSEVSILIHKGLLDAIDVGGSARRHRWYNPEDAEEIRRQLDGAVGIRRVTSETGLHLPAIEQLVEHGIFVRSKSPYVTALRDGLHIDVKDLSFYSRALMNLPLATDEEWVTISEAVKLIGVHEKPVGEIIAAGFKGEISLAYASVASRGKVAGLMVRRRQIQLWLDLWQQRMDGTSEMARSPWKSPNLSHREAMEHLQVHPREYEASIRSELWVPGVYGVRNVCRDKLHDFGKAWISACEIGARLNIDARRVARLLALEEIETRSAARMWSRYDYLSIGMYLRKRAHHLMEKQLDLPLADCC